MKVYGPVLMGMLLALAGCGREQPPAAPPSEAAAESPPAIAAMGREVPILAFGDSLFAGYGLKSDESYPARLEAALRARGINARIANAGVSGNTTADGLARLAFTLDGQKAPPALALVELGANDMLRALPPAQARANLDAILAELGKRKIPVVLMGMLAPPNLGADYRRQFDTIYPALAKKHGAVLVPFFMQAVAGKPALVQPDHLHPTAQGIDEIVSATVDAVAGALPPNHHNE
ncbi:MAG: arylesterase [Novosphingobium sp.]|nr:arylesterase [Novosphingobium sp.]